MTKYLKKNVYCNLAVISAVHGITFQSKKKKKKLKLE